MKIEMELWHLITLLLAFFGCVGTFGKVLLEMFDKRQAERLARNAPHVREVRNRLEVRAQQ